MKIKIFIVSLIVFFSIDANAQRKIKKMDSEKQEQEDKIKDYETKPWVEKIKYGGGVSALFGSGYSFFYLQPWVGYTVSERFMPGIGATYIYQSQTYQSFTTGQNQTISDNVFGLNLFAKELIAGDFIAYVEYAPIYFKSYNRVGDTKNMWDHQFCIGGGLSQNHSYLLVLYDLMWQNWNQTDPKTYNPNFKPSPLDFRVGFIF